MDEGQSDGPARTTPAALKSGSWHVPPAGHPSRTGSLRAIREGSPAAIRAEEWRQRVSAPSQPTGALSEGASFAERRPETQ